MSLSFSNRKVYDNEHHNPIKMYRLKQDGDACTDLAGFE